MIEKRIVQNELERVVEPAHYVNENTGRTNTVTKTNENGETFFEEVPIFKKIFVEAKKQKIIEEKEIWVYNDGVDEHQFNSKKEAEAFLNV